MKMLVTVIISGLALLSASRCLELPALESLSVLQDEDTQDENYDGDGDGYDDEGNERILKDDDDDPEVRPGLFQGDIATDKSIQDNWRVGLRWDVYKSRKWENGIVPYVISPLYDPIDYVTVYTAIVILNMMTCIRFVPWDKKSKDYLLIKPVKYPRGCWSFVGKSGGQQIVALEPPNAKSVNCLGSEGRPMHELLHALGIFHEQSRDDRDKYIQIHMNNVIPGFKKNFDKQSLENTTYHFEYDYNSIMHYGKYFFSKKKGLPTITPRRGNARLGQRRALSKTDCLKVNELYGCLSKSEYQMRKYFNICKALGI